ncbi:GNAT family N-acetyltransferase [Polymorphobacter sp.]|uniref:GNAT family N-acetyltransferase n=1 Tax=Polymorphobacter sp. TaxID=1909290 RepID=UPI003F706DA7
MTTLIEALHVPLSGARVRLEPFNTSRHADALRAASARDTDGWEVFSASLHGDQFEHGLAVLTAGAYRAYAIFDGAAMVGCTSWYAWDEPSRSVAIGFTFIDPAVRGGGFNLALKALMIGHARACGVVRIHFDVDARNARSQAAVLKLGARREGVLRHNQRIWTGHVRDTVVFGLLPGEESDAIKALM